MVIPITILSITVSGIVTWFVSRWYYNRSKDDFLILLSKLDTILLKRQVMRTSVVETGKVNSININRQIATISQHATDGIDSKEVDMDAIEEAIMQFATETMLLGEAGIPIFEIENLISRVDKIKQSLQRYRNWRVHRGA